jgi:hypothetical protein
VYDECNDKRRKVAAETARNDLEYYRGILDIVLLAIQKGSDANVEQFIIQIRAGATLPDISRMATQCLNGLSLPKVNK